MKFDEGSFRDPAGKIFYHSDKVFRSINISGKERLKFLLKDDLFKKIQDEGYLVKSEILDEDSLNKLGFQKNELIINHQKIPYLAYPYEWSFSQLKAAALHHLDFHIYLLDHNATLIDASAYNIQFIGSKPLFIDLLSIKEYEDGEYWKGHKQFCENFLNPLLLSSIKGVQFNNWFKGNLEGINTNDLNDILNFFESFITFLFMCIY